MMGKIFNKLLGCIAFLILLHGANAQPIPADVQVSENLKLHVNYLCSPQLMGRSTLTGHDILATQYVDSLFSSYHFSGLPNFENHTYTQPFSIYNTISEQQYLVVNDSTYLFPDDFAYLGKRPTTSQKIELYFGGMLNNPSIDGVDLKGKGLLLFTDNLRLASVQVQPLAEANEFAMVLLANPSDIFQFYKISQNIGVVKPFENFRIGQNVESPMRTFMPSARGNVPVLFISNAMAGSILGQPAKDIFENIENHEIFESPQFKTSIEYKLVADVDIIETQNVVGYIPAMQNTQQSVVVGAHLDHLEPRSGKWYPGADDNASGTSVMLEVARLIAADYQSGYRPVRNIVFASFTAEEIGLLGSQFYTLNPLFSVDSTVAFINIDMVGRLSVNEQKGLHLHVNGKNRMNDFAQILNEINIDSMLFVDSKTLAGSSVYSLSDHYHYDRLGLPSYILTTGLHADYHEPTDTPEKLSYDGMGRLVKLIYNAVRHFADDSEPWVIAQ
jgi:hypothetical protein